MSNRIVEKFTSLKEKKRAGFVAYIGAGDPSLAATESLVVALDEAGVDVIELGMPFSDPVADGIANQLAAQRGLDSGTTLTRLLESIKRIRQYSQIPLVLYTYMNPIYHFGYAAFHHAAAEAGLDGLLILDLPPDEAVRNKELHEDSGLCHIQLVAPTTQPDRIAAITRHGSGFIYYVSQEGVTGERANLSDTIPSGVAAIKSTTDLPVAVGFGISTPAQVSEVARHADAVVVGSAIVRQIEKYGDAPDLTKRVADFVRPLTQAVRNPL